MTEQMTAAAHMHMRPTPELFEESMPKHKLTTLGERGLLAFTLMEDVEGQWDDVREELEARVVDQQPAIDAIINALDGSDARLQEDYRPRANLAFLGPTGVGKSEMAKSLADIMGGGQSTLLRIDCSNYSHGHEVAGLIGSPVGYIGYGQQPVLNKETIESYGSVVLFDEIEKGSEALYDLMLQIMGDGRLQLNNGQVVSFRDATVILTSNLGAREMAAKLSPTPLGFGGQSRAANPEDLERAATHGFVEFFKPEFVNRLDKMVVFQPLSQDGLRRVLDTKLNVLNAEYETMYGARLTLSDATKDYLVDEAAAEPHNGARPLIRAFERDVQTTFGRYMGAGKIVEGTHIHVYHETELEMSSRTATPLLFASARDENLRRTVASREIVAYQQEAPVQVDTEPAPEQES